MASKYVTRGAVSHIIFGSPLAELPRSQLPLHGDVARHFLFLKEHKHASNQEVLPMLGQLLIDLWSRASIPSQSLKNIKIKLNRLMQDGSEASKHGKQAAKSIKFQQSLNKLFDISFCQCKDFASCKCKKEMKVPRCEQEFLEDQRTNRKMYIGEVDKSAEKVKKRREEREIRMEERQQEEKRRRLESEKMMCSTNVALDDASMYESSTSNESLNEEELKQCPTEERNLVPIPTIALEADRYGVSNRVAAAISTAALIDYGVIDPENKANIVDHHKVWRARQNVRKDLLHVKTSNDSNITAVFFDGRKDSTLTKTKHEGKWYSKLVTEDHYVLIGEPGTVYLDHITLKQGTGANIAEGIKTSLEEIQLDNITAIGADSTAVNTGYKNGAIRLLELSLGKALQWLICNLHLIELPLRHLCKKLIGPTESSSQWKGPIGKGLATCETLPKSSKGFQCINEGPDLPEIDFTDLSRDQAYLYQMIKAVKTGAIADDLLWQKPGPISHARWLTTASRICRLYVSTEQPTEELRLLTLFVVQYYGPIWFRIKSQPWCTDGANHLLEMVKSLEQFPSYVKTAVWPVVQRNSYWAHPENVLLAMLADSDTSYREMAVNKIKSIRLASDTDEPSVRLFQLPAITRKARRLIDLISSMEDIKTEPPLVKMLSNEELEEIVNTPLIIRVPCHSQGVERCVKLVSEASKHVFGKDARDGFIRATMKSRDIMPAFRSKQDFNVESA